MDESLLEIREFQDKGYQPLVDYEGWRVALLRFQEELEPERIDSMERHSETDEVFVLLVENKDTGEHNSETTQLSGEIRRSILEKAHSEQIE